MVYSSDIENVETQVDAGTIKYEVDAFYMKNLNGDEKLEFLRNKIKKKERLTGEDILTLSFIPLMFSKESKGKRALEGIELADTIEDEDSKLKCLTLLYALFDKFGDIASKSRFKEVFSMTEIGRMIREDGIKEGKIEGKAELLVIQLIKKFKKLPNEYIKKIKELPAETIDIIATDIFDLNSIEDLEKYL